MGVKIYEPDEQRQRSDRAQGNMLQLGERVEKHYTSPSPEATIYVADFFPEILNHGLFWGILLGALAGILFGWLVDHGTITPTGWEGLFSMTPFTFYTFWAFVGLFFGMLLGGIGTLLIAQPEPLSGVND